MAGMAEMAQMSAILKYKRGQQQCQCNKKTMKSNSVTKVDLTAKVPKAKSLYKPKQCRWHDLIVGFGWKTNKSLYTHDKPM